MAFPLAPHRFRTWVGVAVPAAVGTGAVGPISTLLTQWQAARCPVSLPTFSGKPVIRWIRSLSMQEEALIPRAGKIPFAANGRFHAVGAGGADEGGGQGFLFLG